MMTEVSISEVRRFMEEVLVAAGTPGREAGEHAALLLHADTTGHFSHGLNRLEFYVNDLKSGNCNANAKPIILKETAATAWVDGQHALGATIGNYCMELAIKKAKDVGVGWVSAKGCNHFGMAGYWALKAEKEGLIGMAFTNSSPILVPTRAKDKALGTNPIAMAAPAQDGDSLVVDMAMTTVALGKIEIQDRKGEPIPEGWALGADGKVTTDAKEALQSSRLLPLGGFEQTSGYKGYGLSAMVEVFCSILSDATMTHRGRPWTFEDNTDPMNLGQCYVALDPECFAPGFSERLQDCLQHLRDMEPVDPELPVLAPGDKERNNAAATLVKGSILYSQQQIDSSALLGKQLGVRPMTVMEK